MSGIGPKCPGYDDLTLPAVPVHPLPPQNESVFESVASYRTATSTPADLRRLREFRPGVYGRLSDTEPTILGTLMHPTWWPTDRPASGVQSLLDDLGIALGEP